jgi:hypothetical protein
MAEDRHKAVAIRYEIRIKGHLSETWSDWFEGLTFRHELDGTTVLSGEIIDQAALHGLLKIIRDLGLPLLSVNRILMEPSETRVGAEIEFGKPTANPIEETGDEKISDLPIQTDHSRNSEVQNDGKE